MKHAIEVFTRVALLALVVFYWSWMLDHAFSDTANFYIIVGAVLLVIPVVWLGRMILDTRPTLGFARWVTIFIHYDVAFLFGAAIIQAIKTHSNWPDWLLPIPTEIGLVLVIITSAACITSVLNLALKGLGAPFAIALSQKLAIDWMYAWTRNPMVLSTLALMASLGLWFRSALFVAWAVFLFSPALLFFVKIYEERELEIRFGSPYLEYKARTPFLFPAKPKK